MRSQEERDEQTLDIVAAVFGGALVFGLPLAVLAVLVAITGTELDVPSGAVGALGLLIGGLYVTWVVVALRRRSR